MALAFTIDEATFNGLESQTQGLYTKTDDGNYQLAIDGLPDTKGLKDKNEQLLGETKKEKEKRKELEAKLAEYENEKQQAQEQALKSAGNIEALEKSYLEKLDKSQQQWQAKEKALQQRIYDLTVGQQANLLANELALKGSASVYQTPQCQF